jgi:hypothetical protein
MKSIASFFLLTLLSITSVFCRKQIGSTIVDNVRYKLYDDGKATIYGVTKSYIAALTIPPSITYNNRSYSISEIAADSFKGKEITDITILGNNSGLLIKENAFNGIRVFKNFYIYSPYVDVELGGFNNIGNYVQFMGSGSRYATDRYAEKLLKQWGLPVRKNYKYVNDWDRMKDLFTLAKNFQRTFGHYDKVAYPDNAVNVMFVGAGSTNGLARLYKVFAMNMGIEYNELMAGCDNIHKCWNYVLVDIDEGKKWYVIDAKEKIGDNTNWNLSAFKKESKILPYLNKFYGETVDPHDFVVLNLIYNYPGETRFNIDAINFDEWLQGNSDYGRTL